MSHKISHISPPYLAMFTNQKSAGKTHLCTFTADYLSLKRQKFRAFQIDDQKRLSHMIGDTVIDLRPNPDLIIENPTLITTALTPLYDAAREAVAEKSVVLLDAGANEVENVSNFFRDVGLSEDSLEWGLALIAFVPFYALDPESTSQAAFTVRRLRDSVPNLRIILVQNNFGGTPERIVDGSIAATNYAELIKTAGKVDRIIMPAIAREYWSPFEGAGIRFLKVLAMNPETGSQTLGRSIGEIKIMKSNVARFWRAMQDQFDAIFAFPNEGE